MQPQKIGNRAETVAAAIAAASISVGTATQNMALGAQVLQFGVGFFYYTRLLAASPIQNNFAQYVCASLANNMASNTLSTACMGVSLGTVANAALAVAAVVTVATVLQAGYNHIMAEKEEEKVNISFRSLAYRTLVPAPVSQLEATTAPAA